ncbi:SIR2-like domain-containing protein [Marinobacter sp. LV10R510-11A]|uniref:SIR2 family protein n=1 Tax=Marinobacter sp. LV10R510-11A TaxID=1415568 RepID=UPI000BB6D347|nr:SIR2 family protein [Marinobacter sp. LV10R510-11A]SOB75522.1 SIR2-like domain-containing protein [Marinobacter sp. LV10R510-11A]
MTKEQELFIQRFLSELEEDNIAIFAGAGLSSTAGYVNWKELLRPLADELNLNIDEEQDLVGVAQFYLNENGRNRISQQLMDEIATAKQPTENHKILSKLPIRTYWTTNYDKLIEKSLEDVNKIVDVKYTINHLAVTKKKRDAIVYKMHGDIDHSDNAVLTKDDYEKYPFKMKPYITSLSGDLVSKTFLFLGFSFTDPNLDYIMSRVKAYFEEHQRQHYCIFKQCSEGDFESQRLYENAKIRQALLIKDLSRFQIKTILVERYSDITEILYRIERVYRRKTIFLSGSAHDYSPFNKADVESFLCLLGKVLIERNYKISSGIGLGIGNAFITGAIQGVYAHHNGYVNDYLNMRPFPQYIEDKKLRDETWRKYRYEVIGSAGIAIFFIGNKVENGNVVLADGVRKEFEIAHELGLALVPVGCSGFMAQELWSEVMAEVSKYYDESNVDLIQAISELGDEVEKPEQLISKIVNVIDLMSKE